MCAMPKADKSAKLKNFAKPNKATKMGDFAKTPLVLTIIGARPQFVKAKILSLALERAGIREVIYHTMQHYDYELSGAILEELDLRPVMLNVAQADFGVDSSTNPTRSKTTTRNIARLWAMSDAIRREILAKKPDFVLVYGDTDSTLSGAFAAHLCGVPLVHIEAGLRSYDAAMPEERNRVLADRLSTLLCAPSERARESSARG